MNAIPNLWSYKSLERAEHICSDDILNKVTQEILELLAAQDLADDQEIFAEAWDVLMNILSFAQELRINIDLEEIERGENGEILPLFRAWNESVQALRARYSRKQSSPEEVKSLTKTFLGQILSYTAPETQLSDIITSSTQKLMERKDAYKPDINVKDYIANYPDFPKPGIQFKDISPILTSPEAFLYVCHEMAESCRGVDKIVALDARGFIFAPTIAQILGIPWVMLRKAGKLPWKTSKYSYDLEYGSATIELQEGAVKAGEKVSIVDDLLATGGTALAAVKLVEMQGVQVQNCSFVIALDDDFLSWFATRKELEKYTCSSVVSYE
jgi:adenine phosphoribosyltransferase